MTCPTCGTEDDRVIDSRTLKKGIVRRRRECVNTHRFTTYESHIEESLELQVNAQEKRVEAIENLLLARVIDDRRMEVRAMAQVAGLPYGEVCTRAGLKELYMSKMGRTEPDKGYLRRLDIAIAEMIRERSLEVLDLAEATA